MIVDGVEYVTTAEAIDRLGPDVSARLLRDWRAAGLVRAACDPNGKPIRLPAVGGLQNVYRWADVVEAEHRTRTSKGGRPRGT